MVTKKKDAYDTLSALLKEIQRTIALVVIDKLLTNSSMKLVDQQNFCYKEFHGLQDSDELGQAVLFLHGWLHFQDAFDEKEVDATENNATANRQRVMKPLLTQDNNNLLRIGKHLTITVITQVSKKKADKISGRQIKTIGELAKKNILKATAFANAYGKNTECKKGPSGTNMSNLYHHVLERMYADDLASGGKNRDPEDTNPEEAIVSEAARGETTSAKKIKKTATINRLRPDKWLFPGFMGFVLFGTYSTTNKNVLSILKSSDFDTKGASRRDARTVTKSVKDKKRSVESSRNGSTAESPFRRGIVLSQHHKLAVLEQQENRIKAKEDEQRCTLLVKLIKSGLSANDQQFRLATIFGKNENTGMDDKTHPDWVEYLRGVKEVAANRAELLDLKKQIEITKEQLGTKRSLASGLLSGTPSSGVCMKKPKSSKKVYSSPYNNMNAIATAVSFSTEKSSMSNKKSSGSHCAVPLAVVQEDYSKSHLPSHNFLVSKNSESPTLSSTVSVTPFPPL